MPMTFRLTLGFAIFHHVLGSLFAIGAHQAGQPGFGLLACVLFGAGFICLYNAFVVAKEQRLP